MVKRIFETEDIYIDEIKVDRYFGLEKYVTPSRVRELKFHQFTRFLRKWMVTPSRVCTENYDNFQIADLHPLRPKYKAKANHNHILINKNSAETLASAPNIIP